MSSYTSQYLLILPLAIASSGDTIVQSINIVGGNHFLQRQHNPKIWPMHPDSPPFCSFGGVAGNETR